MELDNFTSKKENVISIKKVGTRIAHFFGEHALKLMLLVVFVILGIINVNFRQLPNIQNILLQSSFIGIAACGMTFLMVSGEIDLSIAGLLGLCGVTLAKIVPIVGIIPAIFIVLILGAALGMLNSLIVTKLHISAIVATLGMNYIYLGAAFIWTTGKVVPIVEKRLLNLGIKTVLNIPIPFLIMVAVYLLFYSILRFITYGRYVRAVGSNELASKIAGLPNDRVRIFAFMILGLCTAIAGILLTGMLSMSTPIMATGFELNVIAATVMGGTSLSGGKGTLAGSFTGALFFATISNALNIFKVGAYWQYVVVGLILIVAVAINVARKNQ